MEVKNGFLIFTDFDGELCCVRVNAVESVHLDEDENLFVSTSRRVYRVHYAEALIVSKLIEMFDNV